MRFSTRALAVEEFGIDHVLSSSGPDGEKKVSVYFGPSTDVNGFVDVHDGTTHVQMTASEVLRISRLAAPLGSGQAQLRAPLALHGVDIDMRVSSDGADGRASIERGQADEVHIDTASLNEFALSSFAFESLDVRADETQVHASLRSLSLARLPLNLKAGAGTLEDVRLEGIEFTRATQGGWLVTVAKLRVGRCTVSMKGIDADIEGLRVQDVGAGAALPTRVGAVRADVAHVRCADLSRLRKSDGQQGSKGWSEAMNAFVAELVEQITGKLNIDLVTAVDLPILPAWHANHPIRISIEDGKVDYEKLENNIGKLADAVLDFRLDEDRLLLDKNISIVPFDRKTLIAWPLPPSERKLAQSGYVRLARLLYPQSQIHKKVGGTDEGPRFLDEISANNIDIRLHVQSAAPVALPSGGALRLGRPHEGVAAAEVLSVGGDLTYRPDELAQHGLVNVGLRKVVLGLEQVALGSRRLAADLEFDDCALNVNFMDLTPKAFDVTVNRLSLSSLELWSQPSPPALAAPAVEATPAA